LVQPETSSKAHQKVKCKQNLKMFSAAGFFNDAGNFEDKYLMIMEIFCHNLKENAL
jgi:hypothetical protein